MDPNPFVFTRALPIAVALALSACASAASAPAAEATPERAVVPVGYPAKTPQGVDLVFDSSRGVFAVVGVPDHYWLDQRFYSRDATGWLTARALDGPWTACSPAEIPPGLRAAEAP